MDAYHEYAGKGFDLQVTRVDDEVSIGIYRNGELLVRFITTKQGAMGWVHKILGVLG